ncbi:MAG TPA: ATP-binding protein [Candidatus Saccharimonadales bacterium]|nr:ATP-binding protein [Candidatus Saccharimonadales bacterium]
MHRQLTLYTKLGIAIICSTVTVALFSFYEIRAITYLNTLFTDFSEYDTERIRAVQETRLTEQALRIRLTEYDLDVVNKAPINDAQKLTIARNAAALQTSEESYATLVRLDKQMNVDSQQLTTLAAQTQRVVSLVRASSSENSSLTSNAALTDALDQLEQTLSNTLATERKDISDEGATARSATIHLQRATVAMSVTAIVLTAGLVILFIAWISQPIFRLKAAADRIAGGDLSELTIREAPDIFGQLAASLNRMSVRLRDSYRRLSVKQQQDEAILQNMGEGVMAIDDSGKMVLTNHAAQQYLGQHKASSEKIYLQQFNIYAADDTTHTPLTAQHRPGFIALKTGKACDGVFSYYYSDGRRALLHISATPNIIDGQVIGATMLFRDITKEHEIDRMKTEFISLASHQLRTPLSAIKWYSEMLLAGDAGALQTEQTAYVHNVADATERMIELVNALLDISRIESGRIIINPTPTDLHKLIEGIVCDVQAKAHEKQQKIIISVNGHLPKIPLDGRLISQVYMNLITNAIKYTPSGGEITIFISRTDDTIVSQVSDTGYGIPREEQSRIFERFFRASNTAKRTPDGTGLGLYLTKIIVESSGGTIWFTSEEGKGTSFWFSIPVRGMQAKEGQVTLHE